MFGVKDGFDIVIGNPPYGDLLGKNVNRESKKYIEKNYEYSTISDISSPFIERSFNLLKNGGNLIFIITYAITFNKDFSKNRELLANNFGKIVIYNFDRDKCRIFQNMTQSVSILMCFNKYALNKEGFYTSRMFRKTPDIYKINVSNCDKYLLPKNAGYNSRHRLPKIGEDINRQILEKLFQYNFNLKEIIKSKGTLIWIRTSGNYWYNAFDFKPYDSVEISPLYVEKNFADFLILLMNTSIFYFWFRIYGDGRHLNIDILEYFPLPDKEKIINLNILFKKMRKRFMEKLLSVFDKEHKRFMTSNIKSEIDLLDLVICKNVYSLDKVEIYHILNYDYEVRGGIKLKQPFSSFFNKVNYYEQDMPNLKIKSNSYLLDLSIYKLYDLTYDEVKIIDPEIEKIISQEEYDKIEVGGEKS
jgi:hypothetical protein